MRQRGFTYLGLIILLAVIALVGAAGLKMGSVLQRAAAEQELLDIGAAFSDALGSYAAATPKGQPPQPPSLQDLLKDPRFPDTRRHLRKLFVDPITGSSEWGIMRLGGQDRGGVIGVYSLSQAKPFKQANFDARFQNFENKVHLSDWKFTATGQGAVAPPPLVPVPLVPPAGAAQAASAEPPEKPEAPEKPEVEEKPAEPKPEPEPEK